jgi:asparagine synthetase B (glutamine-hydrolysing)
MGTQCLHRLRGEFAFVLWDESNQLLFAARDRFGIKPLFYAMVGDTLYFASEVKALFAAGVPARWDRDSFFQQLFVYLNQDRTLFEGVYQLEFRLKASKCLRHATLRERNATKNTCMKNYLMRTNDLEKKKWSAMFN